MPAPSSHGDVETLTSRKNPLVAECRQLARGRSSADSAILLDGLHLASEAWTAGVAIRVAIFRSALLDEPASEAAALAQRLEAGGVKVVRASDLVMEAVSPTSTSSGVVAVASPPASRLGDVFAPAPALCVIAIEVQDPGNLGAISRATEAAGGTGIIVSGTSADPFGWKALRGSMGSALRLPIGLERDPRAALRTAREHGALIVTTASHAGRTPDAIDFTGPVAVLVGSEGLGVPAELAREADQTVSIPMRSPVESLNVAVATGVLLYEALRQRSQRS